MIKYDGKEFRNLQEQVLENMQNVQKLLATTGAFSRYGINIVGSADSSSGLPEAASYGGNLGDAYLVGTAPQYHLYVLTKEKNSETKVWKDLGQFPVAGPQGEPGKEGPQGKPGNNGSMWYFGTSAPVNSPDTYVQYDKYLNTKTGEIYNFNGAAWDSLGTIIGPQGEPGKQGEQGEQGEQGIQGEQGKPGPKGEQGVSIKSVEVCFKETLTDGSNKYDLLCYLDNGVTINAGPFIAHRRPFLEIIEVLDSVDKLPDPYSVARQHAYMVKFEDSQHIFIITGLEDRKWTDLGTLVENEILEEKLNDEVERATAAEEALQKNIDAEQARAQAAEKANADAITAEQTRAEAAEDALSKRIDAEAATRQEEDESLQSAIDTEAARAKAAEDDLQSKLDAEISRATTAEQANTAAIEAEKSRAMTREDEIDADLATEMKDREAADTALGKRIDDLSSTVDTNKNDLQSAIDAEVTRAKAAEKANTDAIEAEESRATTAEQANAKAITDEAARADAAEKANAAAITAEETRATGEESRIEGLITAEETRATKAEEANASAITKEEQRATNVEESLRSAIASLTEGEGDMRGLVAAEQARAEAAEKKNADAIAAETARATKEEGSLQTAIETEVDRATKEEQALEDTIGTVDSKVDAEVTRAQGVEAGLSSSVSSLESSVSAIEKKNTEQDTAITAAQTAADNAKKAADAAQTTADGAATTASEASTAAAGAVSTANAAKTAADSASKAAATAQSTAEDAASDAATALSTANTASSNASTALSTANAASKAVSDEVDRAKAAEQANAKAAADALAAGQQGIDDAADAQATADLAQTAASTAQRDLATETSRAKAAEEAIEGKLSRPTYYKTNGAAMQDMGGVGTTYLVSKSNMDPTTPEPQVGDLVVFSTTEKTYVGKVTDIQTSAVQVNVVSEFIGGSGGGSYDLPIADTTTLGGVKVWQRATGRVTNTSGQTTPFADYTGDVDVDSWHQDGRYYAVSADTTGKLFVCVPRQTITMSPSSLYYTTIHINDGTYDGQLAFVVPDDAFSSSPPTSWSNFLTEFVNIVGDDGFPTTQRTALLPIPIAGHLSKLGESLVYSNRVFKHQVNVGASALFEIVTNRSAAYTSVSDLLKDIVRIYGENYETIATGARQGTPVYRVVVTSTTNAAYWTTDLTPHSIVGSTVSDHVTKVLVGTSYHNLIVKELRGRTVSGVKTVTLVAEDETQNGGIGIALSDSNVTSIEVHRVELIAS